MMQIRKRWPILTAVIAAIAYGANHYQIAGLENLRLEPRPASSSTASVVDGSGGMLGTTSHDMLPWGLEASTPLSPVWNEALTLGEKVAIWQDKLQTQSKLNASVSSPADSWPSAVPIPLPAGMAPTAGLASSGGQFVDVNASGSNASPFAGDLNSGIPGSLLDTLPGLKSASAPGNSSSKPIRVASFNLHSLGTTKLSKPHVSETLVRILRQYDVVALQSIQSDRDDILPLLTERLNQSGRSFDYLIGPRVGNHESREQFAFLFDTARIETDRFQLYTIEDPENLVLYDPLVAWFRCKEPPAQRAFTFSMVNMRLLTTERMDERPILSSIIQAVEHDGRQEDDWMIVGEINGSPSELPIDRGSVRFAFTDIPTDVVGEQTRAGILFSARGTIEFTGRSGAFDFLRQYNLSLERSLEVSEHLPVWAEFSAVEGGEPGRIAPPSPDATQVL